MTSFIAKGMGQLVGHIDSKTLSVPNTTEGRAILKDWFLDFGIEIYLKRNFINGSGNGNGNNRGNGDGSGEGWGNGSGEGSGATGDGDGDGGYGDGNGYGDGSGAGTGDSDVDGDGSTDVVLYPETYVMLSSNITYP